MFPQFFGNNVNQGDQSQSNQIKRQEQGYRPDIPRQQQAQTQYPSMNINPALMGQQFDTRFLQSVNPGINPNSAIQYSMVPNIYTDGVKSMQIPYDRGVLNYPVPMQMVGMHQNMYGNVNPYYQYYGLRQGVPVQNMERPAMQGFGVEYPAQGTQEKQQVTQVTNSQSAVQSSSTPAVKKDPTSEGVENCHQDNAKQEIKQEQELAKDTIQVKEESAQPAVNEITDDIQLAKMLLQIKGKSKESFAANTISSHMNEVNQNRVYTNPLKSDEKRPHLNDNPYDLSNYMMYSGYPVQSLPMSSTVKQPYNPQYQMAQARYQNYYTQPTQSLPQTAQNLQSVQPMQSASNVQSMNVTLNTPAQQNIQSTGHPPIPSPSPLHKIANPLPVGDYYVFCTVCRHGTPISINAPIPDIFKCANCGFTCQLDKHFLSYYNYSVPMDKAGEGAETHVKTEDAQPAQPKEEVVPKVESAPKTEAEVEQTEVTEQTEQTEEEKPVPVIQVKNEETLPVQEMPVKSEPVEHSVPSSPIDIDEVVCSNIEKSIPGDLVQELASRGVFDEETASQEITQQDLRTLKQQCIEKPNEWWIGKFINIEVPAFLVNEEETALQEGAEETKLQVLGEVVGISEAGFVIRLVEGDGKKTITITNIISNKSKCWVILKEGYLNLRVC